MISGLKDQLFKKADKVKTVITGGAGFAGSNFVQYIVGKYPAGDIVAVDCLSATGKLENLISVENRPNFRFIKGDISDRIFVHKLFEAEKPDIIVHFAEENRASRYFANPAGFIRNNEMGTIALLEACRRFGIRHFHQASVAEVYGDQYSENKEVYLKETNYLCPYDPYLASKASADLFAQSYYRTFDLPITISRSSKIYGPHQNDDEIMPRFIRQALSNKEICVYGTGKNVYDWLHAADYCRAIDLIINEGRSGEIYNISSHCGQTVLMAAKTVLYVLGKPGNRIRLVPDRPVRDQFCVLNSEKIEKELGWAASYDFNTGIRQTIEWYLNHRGYWNYSCNEGNAEKRMSYL